MDKLSQMKKITSIPDRGQVPSRKRATILQAIGGYANTGITIIQGLILIPLYLHYIGSHTYGLWLASGGILGMLTLINFGIGSMLIQRIASSYGKKDLSQAGVYFINGMMAYFCICLLLGGIGWGISIWLPVILKEAGDDADLLQQCFQLAVLSMVIGVINECLRSFSQALLRPVIPMISMIFGRVVGVGVTFWMLFNDFGLWAIPVGTLVAESLIFILNLLNAGSLFRKLEMRVRLDRNIIKEYCQTAPVLLMATAGNTFSQEAEPLLITMFLGPEVTTAYMVTRRAADIIFRMLNVVIGSTKGTFSHLAGSGDCEKTKSVAKTLLTLSFSLGVVGFATYVGANQAFVSLWIGESFVLDQNIILFIALGFFARAFRGLLGQMLYGLGDFTYTSIVILLEGIARIALAMWLLSMQGLIGVPLAFTLSCLVAILLLGLRLKIELSIRFYFLAMTRLLLSGVMVFVISIMLMQVQFSIDSWLIFSLYIVLFMIALLITYVWMNWKVCIAYCRNIMV